MTNISDTVPLSGNHKFVEHAKTVINRLNSIPSTAIALIARIGIAGVFWRSGQTKVEGWKITDSTLYLFQEEYALPLISAEFAANAATLAEHLLPLFLIIGLASRASAAGLLAMTLVIQLLVYPGSWPDHFTWAAALVFLIARGPGVLSLDHLINRHYQTKSK